MLTLNFVVLLIARICLVAMFPLSALEKIFDWKTCLIQAKSSWVPGGAGLLVAAILVEAVTPACIVFGWHDRFAAFILAGFCAVTAVLYHPFWAFPHLLSDPLGKAREHFWQFVKNFGLVGGLLLVIFAGPQAGVLADPVQVLHHPFASSYADLEAGR
ncbi:MAG: DoxX family protein [Caulobacteraceae bacterium]